MTRILATVGTILLCLACSGEVHAQNQIAVASTPTQSEEDALAALGNTNDAAILTLQKHTLASAGALKIDYSVWCGDATEITRLSRVSYEQALAYLRQTQAAGKSTSSLEPVFLRRSGSVDTALVHQYEYCSRTQFVDDEDAREASYIEQLLAAYEAAKSEEGTAQAKQDRLSYINRLQSMDTLLKKVIDHLDIFAMFGKSGAGPKVTGLLEKSSALHAEYATVHQKYQAKIAPLLHPGAADPNAPYVFHPLNVPPVAADDKTFETDFARLMLKALEPTVAVMQSMTHTDASRSCAYTRFAMTEMREVRDYGQAYINSRQAQGADVSAIKASLEKINQTLTASVSTAVTVCANYLRSGRPQDLYNTANSALVAATDQQNPAVEALNAAISKSDDTEKCQTSRSLLAIMTEKLIRLELIMVLTEKSTEDNHLKAYRAEIRDNFGRSESLARKAVEIDAKACPAAVKIDMTMD